MTNWVTQAFMRADVFFIQSDTDMPGNIFSLCSKEQDLKSFRSGDYLYTSEFIRIHLNHVQTCLFIASDDAISKFLFGSSEWLSKDGVIPFETCLDLFTMVCNFEISNWFSWLTWMSCELLKDGAIDLNLPTSIYIYWHLSTSI